MEPEPLEQLDMGLTQAQTELLHLTETYKVYCVVHRRLKKRIAAMLAQGQALDDPFLKQECQDAAALRGSVNEVIVAIKAGEPVDDTW